MGCGRDDAVKCVNYDDNNNDDNTYIVNDDDHAI